MMTLFQTGALSGHYFALSAASMAGVPLADLPMPAWPTVAAVEKSRMAAVWEEPRVAAELLSQIRQGVSYRLNHDGSTIVVPESTVGETRLDRLMRKVLNKRARAVEKTALLELFYTVRRHRPLTERELEAYRILKGQERVKVSKRGMREAKREAAVAPVLAELQKAIDLKRKELGLWREEYDRARKDFKNVERQEKVYAAMGQACREYRELWARYYTRAVDLLREERAAGLAALREGKPFSYRALDVIRLWDMLHIRSIPSGTTQTKALKGDARRLVNSLIVEEWEAWAAEVKRLQGEDSGFRLMDKISALLDIAAWQVEMNIFVIPYGDRWRGARRRRTEATAQAQAVEIAATPPSNGTAVSEEESDPSDEFLLWKS